jgi:predicted O-linked N-acetylglucosamine transferase (SPINDLY family)
MSGHYLQMMKVTDMVASSLDDYVATAVRLAQ